MKNWPPKYPRHENVIESLGMLIEKARGLLGEGELAPDERKIVETMRPGNTTIGLSIEKMNRLAVLLETFRKIRFRMHKVLLSPPVEHFFSVPVPIAHTAVNALPKVQAYTLADIVASDFVDFAEEQYEFAEQSGASRRELNTIAPGRYDATLRKIHGLIRERALPIVAVGN